MKMVFLGTSDFAVPALEALHREGYKIVAVVTTPDKPTGRKKMLTSPPVKIAAQKLGLDIFQPSSLKIENSLEIENFKLKIKGIELGIVTSYGKIIPFYLLNQLKHGLLNIHPSLLPKYRGPSPIQSAILHGEKETGVTIMLVDEKIDHGPILRNAKCKVPSVKYYKEIKKDLAQLGANLLIQTLPDYLNGKITPQEQNHSQAILTKKLSREDGKINWHEPANKIFNQIRALNPEPGTWTKWQERVLNILEARPSPLEHEPKQPGLISHFGKTVTVATASGHLELKVVQLAGKKPMPVLNFLNGHPHFLNSTLN